MIDRIMMSIVFMLCVQLIAVGECLGDPTSDAIEYLKQQQGGKLTPEQQDLVKTIETGKRAEVVLDKMKVGQDELRKADNYKFERNYRAADPLYRACLEKREKALGPWHPLVAIPLGGLAECYFRQGWLPQAQELYKRSIAIGQRACARPRPSDTIEGANYDIYAMRLAFDMDGLAESYVKQGKLTDAEGQYKNALATEEKFGPSGASYWRSTARSYAELLEKMGRDGDAMALKARAQAKK